MKSALWKQIAELIGIAAIVASLVFVGLEMRQSRDIARAENVLSNSSDQIALRLAIGQNSEIWIKGNAEESLTPSEEMTYENLIMAYNANVFSSFLQSYILTNTIAEESVSVASLAYFLYENPGAYAKWEELEQGHSASRERLISNYEPSIGEEYQRVVREYVARLKERISQ